MSKEFSDTSWMKEIGLSENHIANAKLRVITFRELAKHLESNDYTQAELAEKLHETQPRVSDLLNKKINKFSADKLFQYLTILTGKDYVLVEEKYGGKGRYNVV